MIIRKEIDLAGKYMVLAEVGNQNQFFKFSHDPTDAEVQAEVDRILALRSLEAARLAEIESIQSEINQLDTDYGISSFIKDLI